MKVTKPPTNLTPDSNTAKQREAIDNGHKPGTESNARPVGTIAPLLWTSQKAADGASITNEHSEKMTRDAANNARGPDSDASAGPQVLEALLRDNQTGTSSTAPTNEPAKNTTNYVLPTVCKNPSK
jgi:hypothetical protein